MTTVLNKLKRRELDTKETKIYERIEFFMKQAWDKQSINTQNGINNEINIARHGSSSDLLLSDSQLEQLSVLDYRLGMFFRKLEPAHVYKPASRTHFHRSATNLPSNHALLSRAKFWLATLSPSSNDVGAKRDDDGMEVDRCPPEYIVSLYSIFAPKFDDLLVEKLDYQTPTLLRQLLDQEVMQKHELDNTNKTKSSYSFCRGADLGCGTGLSGMAFRDCVHHLSGIDLSPDMVERAKLTNCYDCLMVGELEDLLLPSSGNSIISNRTLEAGQDQDKECLFFDLIVSCDVFVYIGDLSSTFQAVKRVLAPEGRGIFAFSTERLEVESSGNIDDGTKSQPPFQLHACARFAHRESYIRDLAQSYGFVVCAMKNAVLRKNKGQNVHGTLTILALT